jgi:multiple antibiotic resistance protein
MTEALKVFLLILSSLFPIVDPLSGSPIFLALTKEYSPEGRWTLSRKIAWNSFFLMIGSYFIGSHVLLFFGVSLPVVQVAGGLIVVSIGWTLLKDKDESKEQTQKSVPPQDMSLRAFYPLTMPLTVGPGSISVAITLGANATHRYGIDLPSILAAVIGTGLIALSVLICYGFSNRLVQALGDTATAVIMRLSAFLLVCIGVQILWNGVSALLTSLRFH